MPLPIEDYAAIGDGHTVALIGINGSLDWMCLPQFDSPACFAGLLGDDDNGHWLLGPVGEHTAERRYIRDTAVLETTYRTENGEIRVTDLMPTGERRADVVRRVEGVRGTVSVRHRWVVRYDYGRVGPGCTARTWPAIPPSSRPQGRTSSSSPARDCPPPTTGPTRRPSTCTRATGWTPRSPGCRRTAACPRRWTVDERLAHTLEEQQAWADACRYDGPWRRQVVRSLVTLRGLTHVDTGGIVAAPTTSLPEDFGGERNWDYRYCWLRDAALTLESLLAAGRADNAHHWRDWLLRAIAGDPADMQVMYTVEGGRNLPERKLDGLAGYAGSLPVRVGNGAVDQRQTDVLGEVLSALSMARNHGVTETRDSWSMQRTLVNQLAEDWQEPDNGLWEVRGVEAPLHPQSGDGVGCVRPRHRGRREARPRGAGGGRRRIRDEVREEIMERGYDAARNTFTQHYDTDEVDASLLVLPMVRFIPGDDPKMLGTIEAVEKDLMHDGLCAAIAPRPASTGSPARSIPFWPARSGWSRRTPWPGGATTRPS